MIPWLPFERRWRHDLMAALIPASEAGDRPGLGARDLEPFWARVAAPGPPLLGLGVRAAVWMLTLGAPLLVGRLRLFGSLDAETRDRLLERARTHRLGLFRQLVMALEMMACFAYFGDRAVRRSIDPDRGQALVERRRAEMRLRAQTGIAP